MSQRDGFTGGFLLGVVIGGVFGGLMGALVTSQTEEEIEEEETASLNKDNQPEITGTEESIEIARRSLENKIAQLNLAIDDVRQQLGTVNGQGGSVEIGND